MSPKRRRHRVFQKTIGDLPGTVRVSPEAARPLIRVIAYGPEEFVEQKVTDPKAIQDICRTCAVAWVNVDGLGDAAVIQALGEIFHLHPLALEDVGTFHQRAKVEPYGDHLYMVTRMTTLNQHVETEQMSLFLGHNFVLTFQEREGDCFDPIRDRLRKGTGRLRAAGPDYLAYTLLDAILDAYFPVLEQLGERLEDLEEKVIAHPDSGTVAEVHAAKRDLLAVRRAIWPQRDAINILLREEESGLIAPQTRVYLRDCYDHVGQIIDVLETYRELASGLLDVYQSSVSNRMNEIMKVLTIIATIFIPLGFLAGLWGMNFDPQASPFNMPELRWLYGYPFALTVMATVALVMLAVFWRRGWLGTSTAAHRLDRTREKQD